MRLFFLFAGVALLLTGCFSPWLWAPNVVTGALGLAGEVARAEDEPSAPDITIITNDKGKIIGAWPDASSDLDVTSVDFSVFEETVLGQSDHSWVGGLD